MASRLIAKRREKVEGERGGGWRLTDRLFAVQVVHVASGLISKGQKTVDLGLDTQLGQFWLQQMDFALESTEKLLFHYLPPVEDSKQGKLVARQGKISARRGKLRARQGKLKRCMSYVAFR